MKRVIWEKGAIREWSAYEVISDRIWWRWDAIGIDRKGDFVQFHVFVKQFGRLSKRRTAAMRASAIATLKKYARCRGYVPVSGALDFIDGAREMRFL